MILHPLFHWAPSSRRSSIVADGLRTLAEPSCSSQPYPYVCCCPSPSMAWALSAATCPQAATDWDCWQIVLNPSDHVEVLPIWGNRIEEVRIHGHVGPDQLWRVGSRPIAEADPTPALMMSLGLTSGEVSQ